MSVISRGFAGWGGHRRGARVACLTLLALSLPALSFGQPEGPEFLVKISLSREFPGILHEGRLMTETHVREIAEFNGVAIDSRGHILAYVGSHWPEFELPGVQLTVETPDGRRPAARLVGVDERISVVLLVADQLQRDVPLGESLQQDRVQFWSYRDGRWKRTRLSVLKVEDNRWLPEKEVEVTAFGRAEAGASLPVEGSAVVDSGGRFLGIVTEAVKDRLSNRTSVYRVLTVPILQESMQRVLKEGNVRAGWMGIFLEPKGKGIRVQGVLSQSPAEKAGFLPGDRILRVDGQRIHCPFEFVRSLQWRGPGGKLEVVVEREGALEHLEVTLSKRKGRRPLVSWALEVPTVWDDEGSEKQVRLYRTILPSPFDFGFVAEPITAQLADYFKCPKRSGLLVKSIVPASPAQKFGFQAGDVLISINDQELGSMVDLKKSIEASREGALVIKFVRDGYVRTQKIILQ